MRIYALLNKLYLRYKKCYGVDSIVKIVWKIDGKKVAAATTNNEQIYVQWLYYIHSVDRQPSHANALHMRPVNEPIRVHVHYFSFDF